MVRTMNEAVSPNSCPEILEDNCNLTSRPQLRIRKIPSIHLLIDNRYNDDRGRTNVVTRECATAGRKKNNDGLKKRSLDIIDIHLPFVPELEGTFPIFLAEDIGFVDFGVFWEFTICFDCDARKVLHIIRRGFEDGTYDSVLHRLYI